MARGVRFLLGFRQYPFLKKTGPGIPVFGYCPFPFVTATQGASTRRFVRVSVCARVVVGSYSSRGQERRREVPISFYCSFSLFLVCSDNEIYLHFFEVKRLCSHAL